ncbi:hypothetical protein HAN_2g265 (nucleomorph) [Hemiselmis andersenii]|uniref:Uncharacterized protein n=1 Tax=Hemiselmis andersenii TaxID=464988 RepID=A9BKT4_HEMAN|nr:hypothetical protein HAN_2g265 [Hemiselmis andersenii]ABW98089.1 hypothetical protein HAN_2g265 [Hemiselmis andersenii]
MTTFNQIFMPPQILKNFKKYCFYWNSFYFFLKQNFVFFLSYRKKNFSFPKNKIKLKFLKFFKKIHQNSYFQLQIQGLKFKPFLSGKDIKKKNKKIQNRLIKIIQQKNIEGKEGFFLTGIFQFKKLSILFLIKDKKISTRLKNFSTKNLFEETKNEIKLFLNINLIKSALNRKHNLGCGWLFYDKSQKKENFWFSYFSSCFNIMTRYQTINEKSNFKKEIKISDFSKNAKKKDFEFFQIFENKTLVKSFKNIKDKLLILEGKSLRTLFHFDEKKNFFAWRNRAYQRTFLNFLVFKNPNIKKFEPRVYFG